jgi:hypothetical protein
LSNQITIGAGSAVTNQSGFYANSNLIGATNNYGFRGRIPSGTNRWNLYMDGTANNYMAGGLGIGSTTLTGVNLNIAKNITGATTAWSVLQQSTVQSDSNTNVFGFSNILNTQATSFTLTQYIHYNATQGTIGAASSVGTNVGFNVSPSMIGGTTNIAFRGSIPVGTGRWNLFMEGTAANYLAGNTLLGTTTDAGFKLDVNGTARVQGLLTTTANASVNGVSVGRGSGNIATTTAIGSSAGNANTTGAFNTFIGASAGATNSTANQNTFVGFNAGNATSTGGSNTIVGTFAGQSNSTGANNIFIGVNTGGSNTTGAANTFIGREAGFSNLTGSQNVMLGQNAGRFITGGSTANTISSNSIFIGINNKALADNQSNQIVIGHDATGLGTNTTVIGNSVTTTTALYGDLVLGSTTPVASALLTMTSTTEGFLPPRMTTTQKNAISSPATGLVVFDTTLGKLCVFAGTWQTITSI